MTSQTVGKKRADDTQPIVEKIESLTSELSLPNDLSVAFDSKDPDAKIDNPQLAFLGDVYKLISQMATRWSWMGKTRSRLSKEPNHYSRKPTSSVIWPSSRSAVD